MKKYTAKIKVIREYEIGYESFNDPNQARIDAITILKDEDFRNEDFKNEQIEIMEIKENE